MALGKFTCQDCGYENRNVRLYRDAAVYFNCRKCGSSSNVDNNPGGDILEVLSRDDIRNIGEVNKEYDAVNIYDMLENKDCMKWFEESKVKNRRKKDLPERKYSEGEIGYIKHRDGLQRAFIKSIEYMYEGMKPYYILGYYDSDSESFMDQWEMDNMFILEKDILSKYMQIKERY